MSADPNIEKQELIALVRSVIAIDNSLRAKYEIGDKFRFVRDRLQSLLDQLELQDDVDPNAKIKQTGLIVGPDERLVYVYLYNTQGFALPSWLNMLTPKLFYEYSINRPIYIDRRHVESLINSKSNKVLHAFLSIIVKEKDLAHAIDDSSPKDNLGNAMIKVKEGALRFERLTQFTHGDNDYVLNDKGQLVKYLFV